jgi:orotate phosphoribosyltransferase
MYGIHNVSLASGNTQWISGKETDIFLDSDIFSARRSLANLMAVLATADTDEDTVSVYEFRFNDAGRWIVNFEQL